MARGSVSNPPYLVLVDLRSGSPSIKDDDFYSIKETKSLHEIALSADGKLLAVGGEPKSGGGNDRIWVFRVSAGKLLPYAPAPTELPVMAGKISELAFAEDGDGNALIVAGAARGQINIWTLAAGTLTRLEKYVRTDSRQVEQLAFWPEKGLLAAADREGAITLWDTAAWQRVRLTSPVEESGQVGFLAFGQGMVVAAAKTLNVWDLDVSSLERKICEVLGAPSKTLPGEINGPCRDIRQVK